MMGKGISANSQIIKRVLWVVASVVVLAVVIFGVAAISKPKNVGTPQSIEVTPQQQAQSLATRADTAASNDETAAARQLAEQALKLDATNKTAQAVITKLDQASKSTTPAKKPASKPASKPATVAPVAPNVYVAGTKDVSILLPGAISGWTRGTVVADSAEGQVTYDPPVSSPSYPKFVRVTFYVHDFKTDAKAKDFVSGTTKRVYTSEGSPVNIGASTGYSGTDGARLAVVAFARGRYAFEVMVNGRPGVSAADMKALALQLADSLPAAH
jgi:hypothetical protein